MSNPDQIKPRTEWDEKCKDCPVAGILINHMSDPKYSEKDKLVLFNLAKRCIDGMTGQKN